jgi:glucokinase
MNIKVYNNNKLVFTGDAEEFLTDNEYDEDVVEMVQEAEQQGTAEKEFFGSGIWKVEKFLSKQDKENLYFSAIDTYKNKSITEIDITITALQNLKTQKENEREYERQHPEGLYL